MATAYPYSSGDKLKAEDVNRLFENRQNFGVDTGTANAYVVTMNPTQQSYYAGMIVRFIVTNTNTTASTINVDGLGVKDIKKMVDRDVTEDDLRENTIVEVMYDGTNFQLLNKLNYMDANNILGLQVFI
jgi:hypothetical protein